MENINQKGQQNWSFILVLKKWYRNFSELFLCSINYSKNDQKLCKKMAKKTNKNANYYELIKMIL